MRLCRCSKNILLNVEKAFLEKWYRRLNFLKYQIKLSVRDCFLDSNNVILFSGAGLGWLSEALHLCTPLTNTQDVQHLKIWISETWINMAMVDYPYESDFLQPLPPWPIKVIGKCPVITFNMDLSHSLFVFRRHLSFF